MSEPFIVEIWGEPAGIVLRDGNAFRFHATARPFFELDGTQFTTPGHARLEKLGQPQVPDGPRAGGNASLLSSRRLPAARLTFSPAIAEACGRSR